MSQQTPIYHITDLTNLNSICSVAGLYSFNEMQRLGLQYKNIAHTTIQDRRSTKKVPCGPGGVLHDYIPFYFAPRSPMLYTINKGNIPSCPNGQKDVVHLVCAAERIHKAGVRFAFSDGHGIMALSKFYNDLVHLDKIDWAVMKSKYWNDTAEYPDRKRKRQAEFLVYQLLAWEFVDEIVTINKTAMNRVQTVLNSAGHETPVRACPQWYY